MRKLIFIILSGLDQVRKIKFFVSGKIDLNLTTATPAHGVVKHVLVKLGDCIVISSCTNIKHHRELGLKVLANALVKPFVTVDLSIVSLLQGKNEIDSTAFESLVIKTKVPCANLEQMQNVLWDLLDPFVH